MRTLRYVICDVFTDTPLTGNPLAVFTNAQGLSTNTMQALAREMNLSETTFVSRPEKDGHCRVRIFTPLREMPFAGHPTLGTAFVIGASIERLELFLELEVGTIPVRLEREGARITFGWMTQPTPKISPYEEKAELLQALGVSTTQSAIEVYDNGPKHIPVELASAAEVAQLQPDFARLARLTEATVDVFSYEDGACKMRVFAPAAGVPEDPATGSAAGPVAWHLVRQGKFPVGEELRIDQGIEIGRPSKLYAKIFDIDGTVRVEVGGSAVTVARGEFLVRGLPT